MPETISSSRIPGFNGPGGRTNGVGITNTQMKMANSTPKPWTNVRVTMAVNSRIGSRNSDQLVLQQHRVQERLPPAEKPRLRSATKVPMRAG